MMKEKIINYFKSKKLYNRIGELDLLRFIAIVLMTVSHLSFSLYFFYGMWRFHANTTPAFLSFLEWGYIQYRDYNVYVYVPCGTLFLLISGITTSFTKKPLQKALKFTIIAALITVFTAIPTAMGFNFIIIFGVIHLHAFAMWVYCAIYYLSQKAKDKARLVNILSCLILGAIMVFIGALMNNLRLHPNSDNDYFFIFGFFSRNFYSADYYPAFPWCGVFLIGVVIGHLFYKDRKPLVPFLTNKKAMMPFSVLSAYSLEYYFLHPVLLVALVAIIGLLQGLPLF